MHEETDPSPLTWTAIFELWRDSANPTDGRLCRNMSKDIGADFEAVRQWYKVGAVPSHYWRPLVSAIARHAGNGILSVTYEDLVAATERLRPPKLHEVA
jgi:hypothetical protein